MVDLQEAPQACKRYASDRRKGSERTDPISKNPEDFHKENPDRPSPKETENECKTRVDFLDIHGQEGAKEPVRSQ